MDQPKKTTRGPPGRRRSAFFSSTADQPRTWIRPGSRSALLLAWPAYRGMVSTPRRKPLRPAEKAPSPRYPSARALVPNGAAAGLRRRRRGVDDDRGDARGRIRVAG